ncbi:hypothetical protein [Propionibacterium acidifaciens]|uniref:hypothetical protein n=1 Tax=Propionibacterium acidifaciens TaxID=556499 RepID=UPI00360EB482
MVEIMQCDGVFERSSLDEGLASLLLLPLGLLRILFEGPQGESVAGQAVVSDAFEALDGAGMICDGETTIAHQGELLVIAQVGFVVLHRGRAEPDRRT